MTKTCPYNGCIGCQRRGEPAEMVEIETTGERVCLYCPMYKSECAARSIIKTADGLGNGRKAAIKSAINQLKCPNHRAATEWFVNEIEGVG